MPRTGITAYDILISCPGDVDKYVDVINKCIDEFNRLLGRVNNSEIVGRHWCLTPTWTPYGQPNFIGLIQHASSMNAAGE